MRSPRTSSTNQTPRTFLRALLIVCVMAAMLVWNFSSFALQKGNPAADLDQVRNGSADNPIDPPNWVNGNAGASNAHYKEGESIPYRLVLTNLRSGQNTVIIEWDTRHSSVNAIDYITYYDRINEDVQPLRGLTASLYGNPTYTPIPAPACTDGACTAQNSFNALSLNDKRFTSYNATNVVLTYEVQDPLLATEAQTATSLRITFNTTVPNVLFAWGGHIASRGDWGFTNGVPNSAGGISGSPYHTRLLELNGSGGNQDRSLSAAAVAPPAGCMASGPNVVCENQTALANYTVAAPDASATYTWTISNSGGSTATIADFNGNPSAGAVYANVDVGAPGSYTVTATPSNAGGTGAACSVETTVRANTATTDLQSGQSACLGGTLNFSTMASGGDGSFTYAWTLDGSPIAGATGSSVAINTTGLSAGSHTVAVTATGYCSESTESTTFTVKALTTTTDPTDASICQGQTANFSTTASGEGPFTFVWKNFDSQPIASGGRFTITSVGNTSSLSIANAVPGDSGQYSVEATGACNTATQLVNLTVSASTVITDELDDASACFGSTATKNFTVAATGSGTLTYAWKVDGSPVANNNQPTLAVNPSTLSVGPHTVSVDVTGDCGTVSDSAALTITPNPTVTMSIENACATSATLVATPAGGSGGGVAANYTYLWSGPGVNGATTQSVSVNATGIYTVTVSDGNSCGGSTNGQICFGLVTPAPASASMQVDLPAANPPVEVKQPEVKRQSEGIIAQIGKLFSWLV